MQIKLLLSQALIFTGLILSGCGGGSGGDSTPITEQPPKVPTTPAPPSPPTPEVPVIEQALFSATSNINSGNELWITDGTETGTKLVKDINIGGDSDPYNFTKVGTQWFFIANDGIHGQELWVTDGTEAGTSLVEDINAGTNNSSPDNLIAYKGKLIFSATDNTGDRELWISDGSAAGTTLIKDILPGNRGSSITNTVLFDNHIYFSAKDQNHLRSELWKTDGTEVGTALAARINNNLVPLLGVYAGSLPKLITPFGNELIMTADSLKSHNTPIELEPYVYLTDGSVSKMKDIFAGQDSSLPNEYTVVGNKLFFVASDGFGFNLWMYSNKTTSKVTSFTSIASNQAPKFLTAARDKLYFVATDPATGAELWVSDGTPTGTHLVKDINTGTNSNSHQKINSNKIDLTSTAIKKVSGNNGAAIRNLKTIGNQVFFVARADLSEEDALWVSDGTEAGTIEVSKISSTGSDPDLTQFIVLNDKLLFSANDAIKGSELWSSDGTAANTVLVKDINPDASDSDPQFVAPEFK